MNRNPFGTETKVARPAAFYGITATVLGFIHYYAPQWNLPPVPLVVLAVGALSTVIGYYAPHTPRPEAPRPVVQVQYPASATSVNAPAIQPPATTTGGTT